MRIKTKYLDRVENRKLREKRAIVIHWPAGSITSVHALWKWMNAMSSNSYHGFISRDLILKTRDPELRAIHCGHKKYTNFAKNFFGHNVCSAYDSPNNYTHGYCILHDNPDGGYYQETIDTAAAFLAGECFKYGYNPLTQILRHSDITPEKAVFCPKYFKDNDLFYAFKRKVNKYMNDFFVNAKDIK